MCGDWNQVKENCLETFGATKEEQEAGQQLMRALIAFRNHYIKSMVRELRKHLEIVAQAVGSADLTSDFDVTLAGKDDLDAFAEANEAFRQAWKREAGVVFDTNYYFLREWLTVGNNIVQAAGGSDLPGD